MFEQRAYLRIREGGFIYLLGVDQAVSIEHRQSGVFDSPAEDGPVAAWSRSGGRVPVLRLGRLLDTPAGEWQHAILLSDQAGRIGMAAEHIHPIPGGELPVVQPFNPVGARVPGGALITGLCPHTEPEHLVLDQQRLQQSLRRAAERDGG